MLNETCKWHKLTYQVVPDFGQPYQLKIHEATFVFLFACLLVCLLRGVYYVEAWYSYTKMGLPQVSSMEVDMWSRIEITVLGHTWPRYIARKGRQRCPPKYLNKAEYCYLWPIAIPKCLQNQLISQKKLCPPPQFWGSPPKNAPCFCAFFCHKRSRVPNGVLGGGGTGELTPLESLGAQIATSGWPGEE